MLVINTKYSRHCFELLLRFSVSYFQPILSRILGSTFPTLSSLLKPILFVLLLDIVKYWTLAHSTHFQWGLSPDYRMATNFIKHHFHCEIVALFYSYVWDRCFLATTTHYSQYQTYLTQKGEELSHKFCTINLH